MKQSRSKEEFGTFSNPRLEDLEETWTDSRSRSPFLIKPTFQPVPQLGQTGQSHQDNPENFHLNQTSPFKQSVGTNSYKQSNPFHPVLTLEHQSNSGETFNPFISLWPLHQEDPYNEDIWAAYSKNAQEDVLSHQRGFESGPEWSTSHILNSLQPSSMELLLHRLRIYEPPNIDNMQSWLEIFESIFRFQPQPN